MVPNLLGPKSRRHVLCTFLVPCDIKTVINLPIWQLFWSHPDLLQVPVPGPVPVAGNLWLRAFKNLACDSSARWQWCKGFSRAELLFPENSWCCSFSILKIPGFEPRWRVPKYRDAISPKDQNRASTTVSKLSWQHNVLISKIMASYLVG